MELMASGLSPQMVWAFCKAAWQTPLCHWSRPSTPCSLGLEWEWINQTVWERSGNLMHFVSRSAAIRDPRPPLYLHLTNPRTSCKHTENTNRLCGSTLIWFWPFIQWSFKKNILNYHFSERSCCVSIVSLKVHFPPVGGTAEITDNLNYVFLYSFIVTIIKNVTL